MRTVHGINVGSNIAFRTTTTTLHLAALNVSPVPESPDASLVAAARAGDTGAFGDLYARYSRMVHGILLARMPPSEVDDLVHDVFLRAFARLNDLRDASRFGAWLGTITRNLSNDFHRQSRSRIEVNQDFSEVEIEDRATESQDDDDAIAAFLKEREQSGDTYDIETALASAYQAKGLTGQAEEARNKAKQLKDR